MSVALDHRFNPFPDAELIVPAGDRIAWLKGRDLGVGGSEMAALKGQSKYGSAYTVWARKTGRMPEELEKKRMRRGQRFESPIADEYSEASGKAITVGPGLLRSRVFPHMLATPDYYLAGDDTGLECKYVESYGVAKQLLRGEPIPAHWWWQMVTYLAVTGLSAWRLVGLIPMQDDLFEFTLERGEVEQTIDALGPFVEEWWTAHIVMDIAPDDGAPLHDGPLPVYLGDAVEAWLPDALLRDERRLEALSAARDDIDAEEAEIRALWKEEVGPHKYLTANGRRVLQQITGRAAGKWDRAALLAKYPEASEFWTPGKQYRYVKFLGQETP